MGSSRPLIAINGVPQFRVSQSFDIASADEEDISNLINIPLNDIKSIEVLKDYASTEVYGPQGSEGVINIKTNSGSARNAPLHLESDPSEPVYIKVEDMPEFPGGELTLLKFIARTIRYPSIAQESGIEGKVYISFIIDKYGNVTNARVEKSVDASLDKEALRVIRSLPRWKPGRHEGKAVNVSYTIPVSFGLQN